MAGRPVGCRPPRASRAPAGRTVLVIAGLGFDFESDSRGIISVLRRRYGRFAAKGRLSYKFRAFEGPPGTLPFKPAVFLKGSTLRLGRGDFRAELDETGSGRLYAAPNEQCLDAFLRSLISSLLTRSGGFMLHSAGIMKNGKAHLFLGKSGAGKSTLSKLAAAAGAEVISDEINLVGPARGGFRVYGSPFWGEMRAEGRPGSWPLGGIYLLKKARANRVADCVKAEAFKTMLRCLLNFEKGAGVSEMVLGNAARLLAAAKFSKLEFSKADASFLELL